MKDFQFRLMVLLLLLPLTACLNRPVSVNTLKSLSPHDILVQQDYEPGFFREETYFEFGRVPQFTLYADGTIVYVLEGATYDQETVLQVKLTPEESQALVQQVLNLGFERLESNTDECQDQGDGTMMCVMDASITILRSRLPNGKLKEVKIYKDHANDLDAFRNITSLLTRYENERAQPYEPEAVSLFIRPLDEAVGVTVLDWPLDANWLSGLDFGERGMIAIPLAGENLTRFLAAVSRNNGDVFFSLNDRNYAAFLVPWLPGQDYTAEIQAEYPIPELPLTPAAFPSTFSVCTTLEPPLIGRLRLAYLSDGDVWIWDEGMEPISMMSSGDAYQIRLSPSGKQVVYTLMTEAGRSELWAGYPAESAVRLLTNGYEMTGVIQILAFSFDEKMVAFIHQTSDIRGELWVAHTDGSATRRLVSTEDLMAIITETNADSAMPAGVNWIPNTYTLTYDAQPTYENEGISRYNQRQVWVVDAISGAQGVLFPPGEGGSISYSPDGTTMIIVTPEKLRLMNVEAKIPQPLGVDFFAVGFGEYFAYPSVAWTSDSQALLLAQPEVAGSDQDLPITIWQIPVDGSPAARLLELSGFFPSISFSPDPDKAAYWRAVAPNSNVRELHIVALDGSQHIIYEKGDLIDFIGWIPDFRHFVYGFRNQEKAFIGDLCGEPVPLQVDFYPESTRWLDFSRFLFERPGGGAFELYEGHPDGTSILRLNIENFGGYDFSILPFDGEN